MKSLIFAAGLGTRLKPITDNIPKALLPIHGSTLLDIVIEKMKICGIDDIVVNVHHFSQQIKDHIATHYPNSGISISDETEKLLDTGGGLKKVLNANQQTSKTEYILVHNVDILSNVDIKALYNKVVDTDCDVILLVSERKTQRYLLFDDEMRMKGWTNISTGEVKPKMTTEEVNRYHKYAFAGIQIVNTKILNAMQTMPDKFAIMDFYINNCKELNIKGYVQANFKMMDVGKIDMLSDAEQFVKTL